MEVYYHVNDRSIHYTVEFQIPRVITIPAKAAIIPSEVTRS